MARPYKRTDGRWEVRYKDASGRTRSIYGRTSKECSGKLRAALNDRDAGKLPAHSTLTLRQFLDLWLEDTVRPNHAGDTLFIYRYYADLVTAHIGDVKLKDLRPHQIQHVYTQLRDTLSARTVRGAHSALRSALNLAVQWDMIAANPTAKVKPPRADSASINPLSHDEATALLQATEGRPYHLVWLTLIQTGLRIGELGGLLWPQVDTSARTIQVTHILTTDEAGHFTLVQRTKTPRSRRPVRISADLAAALEGHRHDQLAGRAPTHPDHPYVFTTEKGDPVHRYHARYHLKKDCRLAGIEPRHPHELRHTCATLLLTRNVNPKIVQELLGHSSIKETMDTYSHYIPSLHTEAADVMQDLFREGSAVESAVNTTGGPLKLLH